MAEKISSKKNISRCIFYDQVLPILLSLDPDDLLNIGRASPRLYRLVSDWEVWTHLLKRVTRFSNERVEQLINFREESSGFGIVPRPKMILEMVKEVAFRCQEVLPLRGPLGRCWRVTLALDNEEAAHTYEMTGYNYRKEFNRVATMVEFTMFTIVRVHTSGWGADMNTLRTLRMLAAQVERQDSGSLCNLEVEELILVSNTAYASYSDQMKPLLELIKASEEWKIESVLVLHDISTSNKGFSDLAKCSARGHVGILALSSGSFGGPRLIKEDVKAIWEISEKIGVNGNRVGGGRDKDSNITWEEAYESLKMFC